MNDQAESLRKMVAARNNPTTETKVISVISGKGGVGKSNISLNFALSLREYGKKVLLFDLDIGMANLDILIGTAPRYNVIDLLEMDYTIWDIMEEGPRGIQLVAGGSGLFHVFQMNEEKRARFKKQLQLLDGIFDYIVFDMGAGASEDSLQFILASHELFLITTPEPPAITDAYAMLKYIHTKDPTITTYMIVNREESRKEGLQTRENLQRAAKRFLNKDIYFLGSIPQDKHVLKAVKAQQPFYVMFPNAPATKALKRARDDYLGNDDKEWSYSGFIEKLTSFFKKETKQ